MIKGSVLQGRGRVFYVLFEGDLCEKGTRG